MYTIAGIFIYYPSFMINIPDTTLESLVPTEGGCKKIFGDEMICKRKVKCFFKKCSLIEDPIGYKLDKMLELEKKKLKKPGPSKKIQKIVGGRKKTLKVRQRDYMKYVPKKVLKEMKRSYNREMKAFMDLFKSVVKDNKNKMKKQKFDKKNKLNPKKYVSKQRGGLGSLQKMAESKMKMQPVEH